MGHHKTSRMILTTALLYSNWKTSPRPSWILDFENFSKMVSSKLIPFTGALPISEMKTIVPDEFVLHKLQKKIKVHMWLAYDERVPNDRQPCQKRDSHLFIVLTLRGKFGNHRAYLFPTPLHIRTMRTRTYPSSTLLALSSWSSSITTIWGDWRLPHVPHNKANQWDCVVNAIIWVI